MRRRLSLDDLSAEDARRNPDWSRDETILLMDLYLSAPGAGKNHPEVIALSLLLRAAARRQRRSFLASFRNPAGIAMRLRNFGRLDPGAPTGRESGLRPGGAVDRRVWEEFDSSPDRLQAEVARIRREIAQESWHSQPRSSRGPVPSFGARTSHSDDGLTSVYLILIDGPPQLLNPHVAANPAYSLVKLGRTADLDRRMAELVSGLPACSAVHYVPIALRTFPSAAAAHRFERALLDLCDERGWSLGGEFALAPLAELRAGMNGPADDGL